MTKKDYKLIKILIFVKSLEGGTGNFSQQLTNLTKTIGERTSIRILSLEMPKYRTQIRKNIVYFASKIFNKNYNIFNIRTLYVLITEIFWLRHEAKRFRPNYILSIDNHCNVITCIYKNFIDSEVKTILTIHNNVSAVTFAKTGTAGKLLLKYVCKYLFKRADSIVAVSKGVAKDTKKFFSLNKIPYTINIGINLNNVVKLAKKKINKNEMTLPGNKYKKILSIGRFAPQKDFVTLVGAFEKVKSKYKNCILYLIGDGPERYNITSLIRDKGLEKDILLLGWKKNVYPYIKRADVFVLSSNYEGFPYVLLEAAALNKRIVSTDTPFGPREFLENGKYGTLVKVGDESNLANEIYKNLYALRTKKIDMDKHIQKFTESTMLKKYTALLQNI